MRLKLSLMALVGALMVAVPFAWAANIQCKPNVFCQGTGAADDINGTSGVDGIGAGSGNDVVTANGGFDVVQGALGFDTIHGGGEGDRIYGGHDGDILMGEAGQDLLYAGCETTCSQAGETSDSLYGGISNDVLGADNGKADYLDCGDGNDTAYGDQIGLDIIQPDCETKYRNGVLSQN
jgi:Ca2+-binding RTX toxin-like protein